MSLYRRTLAFFLLTFCALGAWANTSLLSWTADNAKQFLDAADVFTLSSVQQQGEALSAQGQVAVGYYVYRHSLKLEDAQGNVIALELPAGTSKRDEFFGDTEIYAGNSLQLRFPVSTAGPVTLHWQGCAEAGICYPPQTMQVGLPEATRGASSARELPQQSWAADTPIPSIEQTPNKIPMAEDEAAAQQLAMLSPVSGILLFFGFGLLLAFTPCMLPMVPIVSTIVVGSQAKPFHALLLTLFYVLAMASTYAVVGVAAGLAGANLQAALQSPWLLGAFAGLFLVLASSLFGMFELQLPAAVVNRIGLASQNRSGGSIAGAAALGFLSALLVGPCMTAPLAGGLLYIGQTGSALYGGLALFALGLGMGLPLLAIAAFGARALPKPGAWMNRVRIAFGYIMLGMAVMMLARFMPGTASLVLWGAWVLSIAVGLVAWAQVLAANQRLVWTLRTGSAFFGLWSVLILVGAASGGDSALQPLVHLRGSSQASVPSAGKPSYVSAKSTADVDTLLQQASARGQSTLIDFYADWCMSCHVIERTVFGDPSVAARLAQMQVVRPDVTRNDATDQALLKHWGAMGPPTMILVGPDGKERRELRVVGEISASEFLKRLDEMEP